MPCVFSFSPTPPTRLHQSFSTLAGDEARAGAALLGQPEGSDKMPFRVTVTR